jgi:hypothetical protein
LHQLRIIVNGINSNRVFSLDAIAVLMDIDSTLLKTIVFITQFQTDDMTIVEFVNVMQKFSNKLSFVLPEDTLDKINALQLISSSIIEKQLFNAIELFTLLRPLFSNEYLSPGAINFLYIVAQSKSDYEPIPLKNFISFLQTDILSNPFIRKCI